MNQLPREEAPNSSHVLDVTGSVDVSKEAERVDEDHLRLCFKRKTESMSGKMWKWAQSSDTNSKHFVHDLDATIARRELDGHKKLKTQPKCGGP